MHSIFVICVLCQASSGTIAYPMEELMYITDIYTILKMRRIRWVGSVQRQECVPTKRSPLQFSGT